MHLFQPQLSHEAQWAFEKGDNRSDHKSLNHHSGDKYQKPHVLVAELFTIYKDLLRVLRY